MKTRSLNIISGLVKRLIIVLISFCINSFNASATCLVDISNYEIYCDGGYTFIDFEVENVNTVSNSFSVNFAGDFIEDFLFGESFYTIQVPNNAGQTAGIFIYDNDDSDCNSESEITLPDCSAPNCILEIAEPGLDDVWCDADGNINIELWFEVVNGNNSGYDVFVNGDFFQYFPTYPSNGDAVLFEDIAYGTGQIIVLTIQDNDNPDCADTYTFTAPDCNLNDCELSIPVTEVYCDGGYTFIDFEVNVLNNTSFGFLVNFAGNFIDDFAYGQTFYTIQVPNNPGQSAGLFIVDGDDPDCVAEASITLPNCDPYACEISIPVTEVYCDGGYTFIDFEVDNINTTSTNFTVNFAGDMIGSYPFGQTFYTIQVPNNAGQSAGLFIYDNDNLDCVYEAEVTLPNCSGANCILEIAEPGLDDVWCDADGNINIELWFEVVNGNNSGYDVFVNGDFFQYFPTYPSNGDAVLFEDIAYGTGQIIVLTIQDNDNPDCADTYTFTAPDCNLNDCEISIPVTEVYCDDGYTFIDFEVDVMNNTSFGFLVNFAGNFIDDFAYGQTFYTIQVPNNAGQSAGLFIVDGDDPDCVAEASITLPDCDPYACEISIPVTEVYCDGGNTFIDFEVDNINTTSTNFTVNFAGDMIGSFPFGQTFYTIQVPNNAGQSAGLFIYDNDNLDCVYEAEVTLPNCSGANCILEIAEPGLDDVWCDADGNINIELWFEVVNGNNSGYDVFVNGDFFQYFPTYPSNGDAVLFEDIAYGNGQIIVLTIQDNDNPDCADTYTFTSPDCNLNDCELSIPVTEVYCDGGYTFIDFEVDVMNNTSFGFLVNFAGNFIDDFAYGQTFYTIQVPNNVGQSAGLFIVDGDDPDCVAEASVTLPDCDPYACEISIPVTEVYCDGGYTFIDFEVDNINTTSSNFTVNFAGDMINSFPFGQTFYTIQVPNNAGQSAGLFIYDNDNLDCVAEAAITLPDCSADCFIADPQIILIDCVDSGNVEITINFEFENEGTMGFNISNTFSSDPFNGMGDYSYNDLPLVLGPFPADGYSTFEIEITDIEFGNDCQTVLITPAINCLFPGNGDGDTEFRVNNCDVLNIGLAYGSTGAERYDQSNFFTPTAAIVWEGEFVTSNNYNNADCDGNGIVNSDDLSVIDINYTPSFIQDTISNFNPNGIPVNIDLPTNLVNPGTALTVPVNVGDITDPVNGIFGIAFSITYDTAYIDNSSVEIDFDNGWFADTAIDPIIYTRVFEEEGRIDVALTLIDNAYSINGYGPIGEISFVLIEDIEGEIGSNDFPLIDFTISNIKGITNNEENFSFDERTAALSVNTFSKNPGLPDFLQVFPNLVYEDFQVRNFSDVDLDIKLLNSGGQVIDQRLGKETQTFDCSDFTPGYYYLHFGIGADKYTTKIVVVK